MHSPLFHKDNFPKINGVRKTRIRLWVWGIISPGAKAAEM